MSRSYYELHELAMRPISKIEDLIMKLLIQSTGFSDVIVMDRDTAALLVKESIKGKILHHQLTFAGRKIVTIRSKDRVIILGEYLI